MLDLKKYRSIIFDCDGVILNSNSIKTKAFYTVAKPYGSEVAKELKCYHSQNGGISRHKKFEYFLTVILNKVLVQEELKSLIDAFSEEVENNLLHCEIALGIQALREITVDASWLVVSGGEQSELRKVFHKRELTKYFDGGIFGSPEDKGIILKRELSSKNILKPALFIGDSKYDHVCADAEGFDFIFLSQWTEVENWEKWVDEKGLYHLESILSMGQSEE